MSKSKKRKGDPAKEPPSSSQAIAVANLVFNIIRFVNGELPQSFREHLHQLFQHLVN